MVLLFQIEFFLPDALRAPALAQTLKKKQDQAIPF